CEYHRLGAPDARARPSVRCAHRREGSRATPGVEMSPALHVAELHEGDLTTGARRCSLPLGTREEACRRLSISRERSTCSSCGPLHSDPITAGEFNNAFVKCQARRLPSVRDRCIRPCTGSKRPGCCRRICRLQKTTARHVSTPSPPPVDA